MAVPLPRDRPRQTRARPDRVRRRRHQLREPDCPRRSSPPGIRETVSICPRSTPSTKRFIRSPANRAGNHIAENPQAERFHTARVIWVTVTSFLAGGYLAGRMRRRRSVSPHETEVRDGVHGLLVWGARYPYGGVHRRLDGQGVLLKRVPRQLLPPRTRPLPVLPRPSQRLPIQWAISPTLYSARQLLAQRLVSRSASTWRSAGRSNANFARNALQGEVSPEDQAYLVQIVARDTGLSEADAKTRVDTVIAEFRSAIQAARDAAEKARKFGLLLAFLTAATLVVSAAAAWWAATRGGDHRDQGTDFSALIRWA